MEHGSIQCPDSERFMLYFSGQLDDEETKNIEEHFHLCDACIEEARLYREAFSTLLLLKARPEMGRAWVKNHCDVVTAAAAGSKEGGERFEVRSRDGKYILRLIPFIDEDSSILEIELADKNVQGEVTVANSTGTLLKSKVIKGLASGAVKNPVDLNNTIIMMKVDL